MAIGNRRQAGVPIRYNVNADVEKIRSLAPDCVILATGAAPVKPHIPGVEQPHVYDALTSARKAIVELG